MKIFAYIGSYRGKLSYSNYIIKETISIISKNYKVSKDDIFICSPNNYKIYDCIGCCNCFSQGNCTLKDDMNFIKEKLMESDLIIFSSPVYLHHVTGNCKSFIDRIAHWTHIMKLSGKLGVVISITDSNGAEFVTEYLSKVMEYLGISIIEKIEIKTQRITKEALDSIIRVKSKKIIKEIDNGNYEVTSFQEIYYQMQRQTAMGNTEMMSDYEKKYLLDRVDKYEHFNEYFQCYNKK